MAQRLFWAQLIAHLSIIPMVIYGEPIHFVGAFVMYFFTGCLGMSMTYHRLVAHGSWKAPRWFEIIGLIAATLALTGSCIAWCGTHRTHHKYSDRSQDPHSPYHKGYFRAQFLSMFEPLRLSSMKGFAGNRIYSFFHRHYWTINFAYMAILVVIDPFALVYLYLFPACLIWNAGSLINTAGHRFGSQPYKTGDQSRNNILLGILVWGEGWHNNHHRYPKSSQFGRKFWELDISGLLIRMIEKKG